MARPRQAEASPDRLILDSGAVIAIARGDERGRAFVRRALELDADVHVPVVVLAETLRGGPRDTPVRRLIKAVGEPDPLTAQLGREAGAIMGRTGRNDTVDAIVVAEAAARGSAHILTGDPKDLTALAVGLPIVVHALA